MLKRIENLFDFVAVKEDLRKIGVTFVTGGIAGIFLTPLVSFVLAGWLALLGALFLFIGLIKMKRGSSS